MYSIDNMPREIYIGANGTNKQYVIPFDITPWKIKWPDAVYTLIVQRPYDSSVNAYVGNTAVVDNALLWTVGYADTQYNGRGKIEIHAVEAGTNALYAKSSVSDIVISESISDDATEAPAPMESWVQRVESAAANAAASAEEAAASAASIVVDTTLSQSGKAADAKATGDAINKKADRSDTDARLTNIEYALAGYAFREEEDDDDAYTKVVPASAMPYAELDAVGGKTVVWNRSPQTVRSNDQSITGITYTRIDDNTCRVHGTNTGTGGAWPVIFAHTVPPSGHKCYFFGLHALTEFAFTDGGFYWQPFGYFPLTASDCILTSNGTNVVNAFLVVPVGKTLDITIHPQFVDLTQMFGAGHEPTLEQCRQIFAAGTYPYSAPTIKHAGVTGVKTVGKNMLNPSSVTKDGWNLVIPNPFTEPGQYTVSCVKGSTDYDGKGMAMGFDGVRVSESTYGDFKTDGYSITITVTAENVKATTFVFMPQTSDRLTSELEERGFQIERGSSKTGFSPYVSTSYPIPAAVQALDGYGWSAGDVSNGIEWDGEKWWYVKRVGRQHMSEIYLRIETYNSHVRCVGTIGDVLDNTTNLMSNKYISNRVVFSQNNVNLAIGAYSSHNIYLRDDSLEGGTSGRQPSLDDVYLFYELATPVRTDITNLMTMDGYVSVEAGGTVTFEHAMGTTDNIRVPVQNKETFLIKLPGGGL